MADAKIPTRPPPPVSRRPRRDPRAESQPPSADELGEVHPSSWTETASHPTRSAPPAPVPPPSPVPAPAFAARSFAPAPNALEASVVRDKLAELEAEVAQLRGQNEKD